MSEAVAGDGQRLGEDPGPLHGQHCQRKRKADYKFGVTTKNWVDVRSLGSGYEATRDPYIGPSIPDSPQRMTHPQLNAPAKEDTIEKTTRPGSPGPLAAGIGTFTL